MKKRNLSYFLLVAFVLVMAVLLFQPASAQAYTLTINIVPAAGGTVNVNVNGAGAVPYTAPIAVSNLDYIILDAIPSTASGYVFSGWQDTLGAVSGSSLTTDFNVSGNHTITATFTLCRTLTTTSDPAAGGSISISNDANCPTGRFEDGSTATITASANDGYKFDNWSGSPPLTSSLSEIQILMGQDRTVTAHFSKVCQPLTLSRNSASGGSIPTATPKKVSCPTDHEFKSGESTTLTAAPVTGWKVTGWTIGGSNIAPTGNTHALTMPALPEGTGLIAQVNYGEKATFGFASTLPQAVAENAGTIQVEVVRDPSTVSDAGTIQYTTVELSGEATEDVDFTSKSGSLTFAQGQNSRNIVIELKDDNITEGQESFEIRLSKTDPNIKLGVSTIEVQIIDDEGDPTIRFEQSDYVVDESSTSVTVAVTVFPLPASDDVFVDVTTQDDMATAGEDYAAISDRTLRIRVTSGQTRKTTNITLTPDNLDELDEETVILKLSNPSSNAVIAADSDAVIRIVDDDLPPLVAFSKSEYYIKKAGNTEALIPVNLSAPSGQKVKVDYNVTHVQSGNIQADTLSFDAGSQMETIPIPITSANPEDVFTLQLVDPQKAELGLPDAASLFVLSTDISDCHALTLTFNGYGQAPAATSKASSTGCPGGQYVAGELIDIVAQPERGWYVAGWQGTIDDESSSMQNTVEMPNNAYTANASYRVPVFFSILNYDQPSFIGPFEAEPNGLFSEANGPIVFNKNYFGNIHFVEGPPSLSSDIFYFELDLEASVNMTLNDIPIGSDYDLAIYGENWIDGDLESSEELYNDPEKIIITLQPGKYFLHVYARAGSKPTTDNYRMRVQVN